MRILLGMIVVLLAAYGSEWVYRSFLRPTDQPTSTLRAVAAHFGVSGVHGTYYPVRHGFRHSSVTAVIAYKMDNHPIPFAVVEYPSEAAAQERIQSIHPAWLPRRNGALILEFSMWGDDMRELANRVTNVFLTFKPNPERR
jgi:hypothetical protein